MPPLVKTTRYLRQLRAIQKNFNSNIGDDILNKDKNLLWDNPVNAFEDEFNHQNIMKLNEEIKSKVV